MPELHFLGHPLADHQVVLGPHVLDDRLVEFVPGDPDGVRYDHAAQGDDGDLRGAAADVHDHVAGRLMDGDVRADGRGQRFFDQEYLARSGLFRRFADRALFHLGDARRNADDDPRPYQRFPLVDLGDKIP